MKPRACGASAAHVDRGASGGRCPAPARPRLTARGPNFLGRVLGAAAAALACTIGGCSDDGRCPVQPPTPHPCPSLLLVSENTKLVDLQPTWRPGSTSEIAFLHEAWDSQRPTAEPQEEIWTAQVPSGSRSYQCPGSSVSWSEGGTLLAVTRMDARNVLQLWVRDLARGTERQITSGDSSTTNASFAPTDSAIVCERRPRASSFGVIWTYDLTTGKGRRLRDGYTPRWSPRGDRIAYGPTLTIWQLDHEDSVVVIDTLQSADVLEWRPDGESFYCSARVRGYRSIYEVHLDTGDVHLVLPGITQATFGNAAGQYVFAGSVLEADSTALFYHDDEKGCLQLR